MCLLKEIKDLVIFIKLKLFWPLIELFETVLPCTHPMWLVAISCVCHLTILKNFITPAQSRPRCFCLHRDVWNIVKMNGT